MGFESHSPHWYGGEEERGRGSSFFEVYGYQGATDKLLEAVLAEAQVGCVGQPLLIAADLKADPGVIPCLAKDISSGKFVYLALAYSLGTGRKPDASCKFKLDECAGSAAMRWRLPLLVGSLTGGLLLIFLSLLRSTLVDGLLRFLVLVPVSLFGLLVGWILLIGPPVL